MECKEQQQKIGNMTKKTEKHKYSATITLDISAKTKQALMAEIEKIKAYGARKAIILTSDT